MIWLPGVLSQGGKMLYTWEKYQCVWVATETKAISQQLSQMALGDETLTLYGGYDIDPSTGKLSLVSSYSWYGSRIQNGTSMYSCREHPVCRDATHEHSDMDVVYRFVVTSHYSGNNVYYTDGYKMTTSRGMGEFVDIVTSDNPDAYPINGIQDGYWYVLRGESAGGVNYAGYIQSSGTQYIDTGFAPNQNTRVVANFQLLGRESTWRCVFGVRNDANNTHTFAFWVNTDNRFRVHCGSSGSIFSDFPNTIDPTSPHTIDMNKNISTLDGNALTLTYTTIACSCPLYVFAVDNAFSADYFIGMRLFSMRIYDNDVLVRDYWPCLDPDGTVCLYDNVNKEYVYNAGTGSFTAG